MAIKQRTVQEGKVMLMAENRGSAGAVSKPRREIWAVVPPELKLKDGAAVDIRGWNFIKWDKTRLWVVALWRPEDKEPAQFMCERFDREFYLGQIVAEEYFPIGNYLHDVRKVLRVRDKDIIKKIDAVYHWREDDDKVWCSSTAQDQPYSPVVTPHLSLRKRMKIEGRTEDEV
jgi:hypothetical protein